MLQLKGPGDEKTKYVKYVPIDSYITTTKPKPTQDNLTVTERQAIGQLKQRQDIIIKPADKGSGTVVMDKTWYIDECNRHLTVDNPNNKSKPTTAAEHFLSSPNHTANDMILIPIEKIFSNRDSIRKAREAFLIQKGRTIDPDGLNIREETY